MPIALPCLMSFFFIQLGYMSGSFVFFFSDSASNSREKSKRVRDERINTYIVRIIISLLEYLLHSSEMRTHTNHVDFEPVYIET